MKWLSNLKLFLIGLLIVSLGPLTLVGSEGSFNSKASPKVKELIEKNNLNVVGYDYVLKAIGNGTRNNANAIILDTRPKKKYQAAHVPSALAFPETKFDKYYDAILGASDKSKEIIVYCGGYKCAKSPKVAIKLLKKGHKNVKVYIAGMPDWKKHNYVEIDTKMARALFDKRDALFIDARPWGKFFKSSIVGSMSIPDIKFDKLSKFMPIDKNAQIITYCGGYKCNKSHSVAKKLMALGYTNVKVYAAGFPEWKIFSNPITGGKSKAGAEVKAFVPTKSKSGAVMKGADAGSVDGKWFVNNYKSLPKSVTLVDVRDKKDFESGHLKGALNIHAESMKAKELAKLMPQTGDVIFYCGAGGRGMEARGFLAEIGYKKLDHVWYLDANLECDKKNDCSIKPNDPSGL